MVRTNRPVLDEVTIPRVHRPRYEDFVDEFVRRSRPAVITGAMTDWPAMTRWTPNLLGERFGARKLPAIPVRQGRAVFDPAGGVPYRDVRLSDFVSELASDEATSYVVFKVRECLPELFGDVRLPTYVARARWRHSRFWFAPQDVGSVLHRDLPHNLYAQVTGQKRWILVARKEFARVYPYPIWSGIPNYCRADLEQPDLERFPRLHGLRLHTVNLEAGEMLFIPSLWWHQARSLTTAIAVNIWWAGPKLWPIIRSAEAFMAIRRLNL